MAEETPFFTAEIVDNNIFKIFTGEGDIFTVYVDKSERPSWVDARCDECKEIARGIGCAVNVSILKVMDVTATVITAKEDLLARILEAIMVCCSELYHDFICDVCANEAKQ